MQDSRTQMERTSEKRMCECGFQLLSSHTCTQHTSLRSTHRGRLCNPCDSCLYVRDVRRRCLNIRQRATREPALAMVDGARASQSVAPRAWTQQGNSEGKLGKLGKLSLSRSTSAATISPAGASETLANRIYSPPVVTDDWALGMAGPRPHHPKQRRGQRAARALSVWWWCLFFPSRSGLLFFFEARACELSVRNSSRVP